ncbi:hypothetical protein [Nocardiopsis salina]|uniref:hypothetical protein n=1 Tax=Nocardiopsis salina TaxID=245836 RepID=UPI000345DC80|nr:hypothetical protein [Nocardiopsis salina]
MMALLRSRRTMFILAAVVIVGLVVSGGIGLVQSMSTVAQTEQGPGQGQEGGGQGGEGGPEPLEAPEAGVLGQAPTGLEYSSEEDDVECVPAECIRLVSVMTTDEDADVSSDEAVEAVYDGLLEQNWGQLLPEGAEEPDDVPLSETIMTDGEVMVADATEHESDGAVAVLMVGNANPPAD